jgi:Bacterial PH domain
MLLPWPVPVLGAVLLAAAAAVALAGVWRWDRTRLIVTTQKLVLAEGVLRRRESAVLLRRLDGVALERSLLGRLFGYGTVVAGTLRVSHVAAPRELSELLEELIAAPEAFVGRCEGLLIERLFAPVDLLLPWPRKSSSSTAPASTTSRTSPSGCRGTR